MAETPAPALRAAQVSATLLGEADLGLLSPAEMAERTAQVRHLGLCLGEWRATGQPAAGLGEQQRAG